MGYPLVILTVKFYSKTNHVKMKIPKILFVKLYTFNYKKYPKTDINLKKHESKILIFTPIFLKLIFSLSSTNIYKKI